MTLSRSGQRPFAVGLVLVLLGALGFSTKSILIKLAYEASQEADAILLMALRMLFSLPVFLWVAFRHNRKNRPPPLTINQWLLTVVLGLNGYYLASYLDFWGLEFISAGLERVILFLYPTFVILFSALFYRRKITAPVVFALVLSYSGTVVAFIERLSMASANIWLGSGLILTSAVVFACFTIGSGAMVHQIGSTRFTAYTMTVAGIATLTHYVSQRGLDLEGFPVKVYVLALLMTVFSTVLPAFFMNAGIRNIGAGAASIISTAGPIATLVLAHFFLNETVTWLQLGGTLMVLAGVFTVSKYKPTD
ncbi:MAG: DMT family transporter [Gammaproteobacteria bacterium]